MRLLYKVLAGVLVSVVIGGGFWFMASRLQAANERVGQLEAEQRQTKQALKDSQLASENIRVQMGMWRDLYTDLQSGYSVIQRDRETLSEALNRLREQSDVKDYLSCPMPDDLYDWMRKN